MIGFFEGLNLVKNAEKAALLYNSHGKGKCIEIEVGGELLKATENEKLLGLHVSSNEDWTTHVNKLCTTLKQRISLLRKIKHKINSVRIKIVSEAIFNSKMRYGTALYSRPKFEFNHLEQAMDPNIEKVQVVQNDKFSQRMDLRTFFFRPKMYSNLH